MPSSRLQPHSSAALSNWISKIPAITGEPSDRIIATILAGAPHYATVSPVQIIRAGGMPNRSATSIITAMAGA
ncbi:MAG: hypothetical protein HKN30_08815 [Sulfitobacter sp.]|nr:hypothetical protein [Sulfitobacter sp.]